MINMSLPNPWREACVFLARLVGNIIFGMAMFVLLYIAVILLWAWLAPCGSVPGDICP